jgi:hypothetical protein
VENATFDSTRVTIHNDRLQKLVRFVLLVSSFDRLYIIAILSDGLSLAMYEPVDGDFDAIPALVAIHGIISSHDGCDFTNADFLEEIAKFARIASRRTRCGVAPVTQEMDIHMRHTDFFGGLEQRI